MNQLRPPSALADRAAVDAANRKLGPRRQPEADGRVHRALLRPGDLQDGPGPAQRPGRLEDSGPALNKAVDAQSNEGKTTVIEIMCTRELGDPFRRDAVTKPIRFDKHKDYV